MWNSFSPSGQMSDGKCFNLILKFSFQLISLNYSNKYIIRSSTFAHTGFIKNSILVNVLLPCFLTLIKDTEVIFKCERKCVKSWAPCSKMSNIRWQRFCSLFLDKKDERDYQTYKWLLKPLWKLVNAYQELNFFIFKYGASRIISDF